MRRRLVVISGFAADRRADASRPAARGQNNASVVTSMPSAARLPYVTARRTLDVTAARPVAGHAPPPMTCRFAGGVIYYTSPAMGVDAATMARAYDAGAAQSSYAAGSRRCCWMPICSMLVAPPKGAKRLVVVDVCQALCARASRQVFSPPTYGVMATTIRRGARDGNVSLFRYMTMMLSAGRCHGDATSAREHHHATMADVGLRFRRPREMRHIDAARSWPARHSRRQVGLFEKLRLVRCRRSTLLIITPMPPRRQLKTPRYDIVEFERADTRLLILPPS